MKKRSESIPIEIEPKCMVCMKTMPLNRARNSDITTCSPECAKIMRSWRAHQKWIKQCPSCLHPSTLEQREEFKRWRMGRGDIQWIGKDGRPSRKREKALVTLLSETREWLQEVRDTKFASETPKEGEIPNPEEASRIRELDSLLYKIANQVDRPPVG